MLDESAVSRLAKALRELYDAADRPTYDRLVRQAKAQKPEVKLSVQTLSGWLNDARPTVPRDRTALKFVIEYLRGQAGKDKAPEWFWWDQLRQDAWNEAHAHRGGRPRKGDTGSDRAEGIVRERPLPRVREFGNWQALGIHPPRRLRRGESVKQTHGLPGFVARDRQPELLDEITQAAKSAKPRLILIVGPSTAGKSRLAAEAMWSALPEWRVLVPASPAALTEHIDVQSLTNTVIWLDDFHRFLDYPQATESLARYLSSGKGPSILLATLRAHHYHEYRLLYSTVALQRESTQPWDILRGAISIDLARVFSEMEMARAEVLGATDPWIKEASNNLRGRMGLAEYLGAGPFILREWLAAIESVDPVQAGGAAVTSAALDLYRTGITDGVSAEILKSTFSSYLPDQVRHSVLPGAEFSNLLRWATMPREGVAAPLLVIGEDKYVPFDYLIDYSARPQYAPIRDEVWMAALKVANSSEAIRVGRHAQMRLRGEFAETAWRRALEEASDVAQDEATRLLLGHLYHSGRIKEAVELCLERPIASDRAEVMPSIVKEMVDSHMMAELRRLADSGSESATFALNSVGKSTDSENDSVDQDLLHYLYKIGDLADERGVQTLTAIADEGDAFAEAQLAIFLREQDDRDALERRADAGSTQALYQLVTALYRAGDYANLQRLADLGREFAAEYLADLYADAGDSETALALLRSEASKGSFSSSISLARLLYELDLEDELRELADEGLSFAARRLARLLSEKQRFAEAEVVLRQYAEYGDLWSAANLISHYEEIGRRNDALQWRNRLAPLAHRLNHPAYRGGEDLPTPAT